MTYVRIRYAVIASGVRPGTIRQWAARGKLPTLIDSDGKVTYDVPTLMRLEAATRGRRENLTLDSESVTLSASTPVS